MTQTFLENEIVQALGELIEERAERGNCQSKHGTEAVQSYEIFKLKEALDALMTQRDAAPSVTGIDFSEAEVRTLGFLTDTGAL